jgi:hypothetical protein
MIRRALLLFAVAGIYLWVKRTSPTVPVTGADRVADADADADADWANEGGRNSPGTA